MSEQLVRIEKHGDVFVLCMAADENRWNTTFVSAWSDALDEVEASEGPAALVTASDNIKFYSNGLDLEWVTSSGEHPGGDRSVFGEQIMALFARLMTFPIPTVAAINGHAFGAGFMIALCHDVRIQREDRGFLCANEVELGMSIPEPELALFRSKMPMSAFVQTVQLAKRWTGVEALDAGIVQHTAPLETIRDQAIETAQGLAKLGLNREVYGWMKEHIFGENAAINGAHGAAHMLRNQAKFESGPRGVTTATRA